MSLKTEEGTDTLKKTETGLSVNGKTQTEPFVLSGENGETVEITTEPDSGRTVSITADGKSFSGNTITLGKAKQLNVTFPEKEKSEEKSTETASIKKTAKLKSAAKTDAIAAGYYDSLDTDDEYLESFEIIEQQDGSAPWDNDDTAGNDSGNNNNRIRTYDRLSYTLQLTSAPYTEGVYYKSGYIHFKFILPLSKEEAVFDTDAMGWMVDSGKHAFKLTEETIDGKKCQVLTCSMYKSYEPNAFPCIKQTANVQIQMKHAENGTEFTPEFSAWMDHNTTDGTCKTHGTNEVITCKSNPITVSAKDALNVQAVVDSTRISTTDADFSRGTDDAPNKNAGKVHGAFFNIGNIVELRNTGDQNKMLMGIAWPDGGDLTYDIEISPYYMDKKGNKSELPKNSKVLLWNGGPNTDNPYDRAYTADTPVNTICFSIPYGNRDSVKGTHKTGTAIVTQEGNILHVKISGYALDETKYPAQIYSSGNSSSVYYNKDNYGKGSLFTNRGVFASVYETLCITYDSSTIENYGSGSIGFSATVKNLQMSGKDQTEATMNDNTVSADYSLRSPGSFDNRVWYCPYGNLYASDMYGNADRQNNSPYDTGLIGQKLMLVWGFTSKVTESEYWYAVDSLIKFDAKAFTPIKDMKQRNYSSEGLMSGSDVVFAAKKDGTDWIDDTEKNEAKIEDLVYYRTYEELKADGKQCIGMVYSQRRANTVYGWHWMSGVAYPVQVNDDDSLAGNVYSIVETSNVWAQNTLEDPKTEPTFAEMYFDGKKQSEPTKKDYTAGTYRKSQYTDGQMTSTGNFHVDLGDSLYIMTYNMKVQKHVEQKTENSAEKASYNLDNGEMIVDYRLDVESTSKLDWETVVTITDTLPKGMKYNQDATLGGTYTQAEDGSHAEVSGGTAFVPTVTKNKDGTTTLVWTFQNYNLKNDIPAIHYSTTIDRLAAVNNQEYQNTVTVTSKEDRRDPDLSKGNLAKKSVKAVKLSSFSLSKQADQEIYELPEDISWNLAFNNTSKNAESDAIMQDLMPYNNDSAGSDFHGSYTVSSLKLDLDDPSAYEFYYTNDSAYQGKTTKDLTAENIRAQWEKGSIASDGTVTCLNGISPVSWCLIGKLNANTTLKGKLSIKTKDAVAGDTYVNRASMMKSTVTGKAAYLTRSLSGYAFLDADKNGYKDDNNPVLPGVTVTLYLHGDHDTPVKNLLGETCQALTDANGFYQFNRLPQGDYDVVFSGDVLKPYQLVSVTKEGAWYNKAKDAKSFGGKLVSAEISHAFDAALVNEHRDVTNKIVYEQAYEQLNSAFYESEPSHGVQLPQTGAWTWILFSATGAAVILIRIAVCKKKAK